MKLKAKENSENDADREGGWMRRLLRVASLILLVLLVSTLMVRFEMGVGIEDVVYDDVVWFTSPFRSPPDVVLVAITDQDFELLFHHKSPLNETMLAGILKRIINANPQLIVVDIETAECKDRLLSFRKANMPIVWARPFLDDASYKLSDVLGTDKPSPIVQFGISASEVDRGVVRSYRRVCMTSKGRFDSLAWTVCRNLRACSYTPSRSETELRLIPFRGHMIDWDHLSEEDPRALKVVTASAVEENNPKALAALDNKIVVFGGSYYENGPGDSHITPRGKEFGLEIVANEIDAEVREGGGPKRPSERFVLYSDMIGVTILILFYEWLSFRSAFLINAALSTAALVFFYRAPLALIAMSFLIVHTYYVSTHYHHHLVGRLLSLVTGKEEPQLESAGTCKDRSDLPMI
jgi:hypothetical protein